MSSGLQAGGSSTERTNSDAVERVVQTRTTLLATGTWLIVRDDRYEEFRAYIRFVERSLDFEQLLHR